MTSAAASRPKNLTSHVLIRPGEPAQELPASEASSLVVAGRIRLCHQCSWEDRKVYHPPAES